jgi:hypothetical protein
VEREFYSGSTQWIRSLNEQVIGDEAEETREKIEGREETGEED